MAWAKVIEVVIDGHRGECAVQGWSGAAWRGFRECIRICGWKSISGINFEAANKEQHTHRVVGNNFFVPPHPLPRKWLRLLVCRYSLQAALQAYIGIQKRTEISFFNWIYELLAMPRTGEKNVQNPTNYISKLVTRNTGSNGSIAGTPLKVQFQQDWNQ